MMVSVLKAALKTYALIYYSQMHEFTDFVCVCLIDINELNLPKTCQVDFPDPDDLLNFKLIICPDEVTICCHQKTL